MTLKKKKYRRQKARRSATFRHFRSSFIGPQRLRTSPRKAAYRPPRASRPLGAVLTELIKGAAFIFLLVLLVGAVLKGYELVKYSDVFRVSKVAVQGHRVATEAQILDLAGIQLGTPLLGLATDTIAKRVTRHPWIDSVAIRKYWPCTLHITVVEHYPMAMVNLEGEDEAALYYIDEKGVVFAPVDAGEDLDFPVITGFFSSRANERVMITENESAADAFAFLRFDIVRCSNIQAKTVYNE